MSRSRAGLSLRLAALAVLLTGPASVSAAQVAQVKESAYWAVVEEYVRGDRNGAVARIEAWSAKDLESITKSVSDLSKAAQKCSNCKARAAFDALPLGAAILLESETDRRARLRRTRADAGSVDCRTEAHGVMAERLLWLVALQPGGKAFLGRFTAAISMHFRALQCFGRAKVWSDAGLQWAPDDADLLLVRGLVHEAIGTMGPDPILLRPGPDLKGHDSNLLENPNADMQLKRAMTAYEKVIDASPQRAEAHLRRGRILWRLKRFPEAREALTRAVALSEGRAQYLARLFRGRVLEDEGQLESALSDYETARALDPPSQLAALALAHVLSQRGEADRAQEILEAALTIEGKERGAYLYWYYLVGNPTTTEALLDALRGETTR